MDTSEDGAGKTRPLASSSSTKLQLSLSDSSIAPASYELRWHLAQVAGSSLHLQLCADWPRHAADHVGSGRCHWLTSCILSLGYPWIFCSECKFESASRSARLTCAQTCAATAAFGGRILARIEHCRPFVCRCYLQLQACTSCYQHAAN